MLKRCFDEMCCRAYCFINNFNRQLKSERGDTNFISILIILGVVIALATVFIVFKNQIVGQIQGIIKGFDINSTSTTLPG